MTDDIEAAWAAGLFEGEGSFCGHKKLAFRPCASMSITDKDVLDRFVAIVGVGKVSEIAPRKPHHKTAWQWWTTEQEFHKVFEMLRPWLGARRLLRAETVIAERAAYLSQRTAERQCLECKGMFVPRFRRSRTMKFCSMLCSGRSRNRTYRAKVASRSIARPTTF